MSVFMSVCMSVCMYVCLSVCLYASLYVSMSIHLYVCLSINLYVCLSIHLYVCLSVHLSIGARTSSIEYSSYFFINWILICKGSLECWLSSVYMLKVLLRSNSSRCPKFIKHTMNIWAAHLNTDRAKEMLFTILELAYIELQNVVCHIIQFCSILL